MAEYSSALIHRMVDPKFVPSAEDTARFVAKLTDLPLVTRIEDLEIDEKLIEVTGDAIIRREGIFPHKRTSPNSVAVVMTNPLDYAKREAFTQATETSIEDVSVVSATLFEALLKKFFKETKGGPASADDVDIGAVADVISTAYSEDGGAAAISSADLESEDSAPIIQLTNRIIEDAYVCGASDIHIEPMEKDLLIRYRIDGLCQEKLRLPKQVANAMVTRLKIMCNLDISERRLPQDGRIVFKKYTKKNIDIDLRVATGPMNHGEKVVMRILDKQKSTLPLPALGFSDENLAKYRECIRQPYGMILHCGPTGFRQVDDALLGARRGEHPRREHPDRRGSDRIHARRHQPDADEPPRSVSRSSARCAVTSAWIPTSFSSAKFATRKPRRSPSKPRSPATCSSPRCTRTMPPRPSRALARWASSRSTSPLRSSVSAPSAFSAAFARTAKPPYEPKGRESEILQKALGWTGQIFKANPQGCPTCSGTGYKGRVGIHELMVNCEELVEAINKEVEVAQLKRVAMKNGMKTLHQDSMLKVKMGLTTMEDALGNVPPDLIL